jgi:hypothetical protein
LIQKVQNILATRQPTDAVLSHTSPEPGEQFFTADRLLQDEAGYHPRIWQNAGVPQCQFIKHEALKWQCQDKPGRLASQPFPVLVSR